MEALAIHGVDIVFGVPGESYLAALDALHDAKNHIRFITCRQEGGAANMAEAYGKLTGRPGICFVTRGPGATNASIGVHTAFQDSTPMILFIGQVARGQIEREAFQEVDYRRMFQPLAKWAAEIDDARRIPELVSQAFHRATAGRPGPVVLALPEDMLAESVETADAGPYTRVEAHPGATDMARLGELLAAARRPLMIVGGGGWTSRAVADIEAFAAANDLPVGASFRCQDLFDNTHRNYVGDVAIGINPALAKRVQEADLLLAVGPRLGEMTTSGYTLVSVPVPKQMLVHVHPGAEELGRVYQATLPINSGMAPFAAAAKALKPNSPAPWINWTAAARADYLAHIAPRPSKAKLNLSEIVISLRDRLPPNAIVTNGAGNYAGWVNRFYQYRKFRTQLGPTSGAMGYGLPAAIAAKAVHPDRTVVCFAGDGCFLMTGQELATAAQHDLPVIVIVVNNAMYGTIRMHQEREYPERVIATDLVNPDFAAYARAFGAHGETVETTAEFAPAFDRALAAGRTALIELRVGPDSITPNAGLVEIRKAALAKRR